jgi:hypothetical protein
MYLIKSSNRSNFKFDAIYVHDLTVESRSTQNVLSKGEGLKINFDHHRGSPSVNLFTQINLGNGSRMLNSSVTDNRGPHSGIYTTLWNIKADHNATKEIPSQSNGAGKLQKIAPDWFILNAIGILNVIPAADRNQFVEFSQSANFSPENIYEAQFQNRTKTQTK